MKIPVVLGALLSVCLPLRAQSLFVVTEDGKPLPVRAIRDGRPMVIDHGQLRSSPAPNYALVRSRMFGLGLLDINAFHLDFNDDYTNRGNLQIHVFGRLKSDINLKNCFVVIKITGAVGTGVFFAELPDLPAGEEVQYDRIFPLTVKSGGGEVKSTSYFFSNGLQLLTSRMNPTFVSEQHQKTEAILSRIAAPH